MITIVDPSGAEPFMSPTATTGALKGYQTPTSTNEEPEITWSSYDNQGARSLFLQLPSRRNLRGAGDSSSDVSGSDSCRDGT